MKKLHTQEDYDEAICSDLSECQSVFMKQKTDSKYAFKDDDSEDDYNRPTSDNLGRHDIGDGQLINPMLKVAEFITNNPVSASFLKREKGKLPYSVFKATN